MYSGLRRLLLSGIVVSILALGSGQAQAPTPDSGRAVLYAASGAVLTQYDVDTAAPALVKKNSIRLPANVQYAWPHPSRKYFYVAWSDGGAAAAAPGNGTAPSGKLHGVSAFRIDSGSGALQPIGQPASLASRPIHMSVDISGTHILVAYNDPSSITVHRLNADGTIGALVKQPAMLDTGIYAHQVRVAPSNHTVILVTRGNAATKDKPEDRGALKVFDYADGILKNRASIAPDGGVNFQPRHLDFHPSKPWVFVSLERQSKLQVYQMTKDGSLGATPLFIKDSLAAATPKGPRQAAGTIHMHPNGRFVYQANRSGTAEGSENSIAVWAVNQQSGEPTLIQSADTRGTSPRTFALDPSTRVLVVGNQSGVGNLALFRIGNDGKLDFVRKYDVDTSTGSLFWMGIVPLP
jgi:6-phosphogluconolactonase (cycloisomerase 2 family)